MSDPASPLDKASYQGSMHVTAMGLQGMITLRGDLGSVAVKDAVMVLTGLGVPAQRRIASAGESGVAWMSPDELLIFVPYAQVSEALAQLHAALEGTHFLAVDVSDARAVFHLQGDAVRDVIAKLMPVDMAADAFGAGDFRRTRMAQIATAFWMPGEGEARIICFRSVAEYAFNLLKDAAEPGGAVGHYA